MPGRSKAKAPAPAPRRPVLLVLAGVNGAGKSSIGGRHLRERGGLPWFNPDAFTRALVEAGLPPGDANARAWQHGVELLDQALAQGLSHAFETTLGGRTLTERIRQAARTHDVLLWYCGLASPEQHLARVAARVAAGGHDIPERRIRERWIQSPLNLIALMPCLSELKVFDNSAEAGPDRVVPDPVLVLQVRQGQVQHPLGPAALQRTPAWAKPLVQAARDHERARARQTTGS